MTDDRIAVSYGGRTWTVTQWNAIQALARDVIRKAYDHAVAECVPGWEDYPELAEFDWAEVLDAAERLIPEADPAARDRAVALLAPRAESNA